MIRRIRLLLELTCEAFSWFNWLLLTLLLFTGISSSWLVALDGHNELASVRLALVFSVSLLYWMGIVGSFAINELNKQLKTERIKNENTFAVLDEHVAYSVLMETGEGQLGYLTALQNVKARLENQ